MNRSTRTSLAVVLGMIIIVVALVYALFIRPNYYRMSGGYIDFDTLYVGELDTSVRATVSTMAGSLFVADQEGISRYSLEGESIWNKSYHFDNPYFVTEAPYMAVIDLGGKDCHIFNGDGATASIHTDYMIVGGSLNSAGFLTLMLENGNQNYIDMYDHQGNQYLSRRTFFKEDGYPVDVVTSSDGSRMLSSHLDVSSHRVESTVTFLDLSSTGEGYEDRITGHEKLEDTLVSHLTFLDGNNGVMIGDNLLRFYSVEKTPFLLNECRVDCEINQTAHTEDMLMVSYGEAVIPSGEARADTVVLYDAEGVELTRFKTDESVTALSADAETFYVISSSHVVSYQTGKKQWETELHKPVEAVYRIANDRYLLVFDYTYEVVEIKDV